MKKISCPNCKYEGLQAKPKGSILLFIVLCIVFLPLGLLYLFYLIPGRALKCPQCRFRNVVVTGEEQIKHSSFRLTK